MVWTRGSIDCCFLSRLGFLSVAVSKKLKNCILLQIPETKNFHNFCKWLEALQSLSLNYLCSTKITPSSFVCSLSAFCTALTFAQTCDCMVEFAAHSFFSDSFTMILSTCLAGLVCWAHSSALIACIAASYARAQHIFARACNSCSDLKALLLTICALCPTLETHAVEVAQLCTLFFMTLVSRFSFSTPWNFSRMMLTLLTSNWKTLTCLLIKSLGIFSPGVYSNVKS